MQKALIIYQKIEKTLASLKFAVFIIILFAIASTIGTFVESYNGTEYAGRTVYKSWWFMLIQLGMFTSILMATIVRLPPKKSLYGFYTIHLGLMTLFVGSAITYINGVDGSIELLPNKPANKIILSKDMLKIHFVNQNELKEFKLPYVGSETELNASYKNVTIKRYLPFSQNKLVWQKNSGELDGSSASFLLYNDNFDQNLTLSLNSNSDFKSIQKLGLLNTHYMPEQLYDCFLKNEESGFLVWNLEENQCQSIEEMGLKVFTTDNGTRYITFKYADRNLKFFPDFSPVALKDDLTKDESVAFRVFSKNLFKEKPHLFIFGDRVVHYRKFKKKWVGKSLADNNIAKLPWMGFKIKLLKYSKTEHPIEVPYYTKPTQVDNQKIEGDNRAVEVEIAGNSYWVRSDAPLSITNSKERINFIITRKSIKLPYQITLKEFVMKKNPGTNQPASYESFVDLLDGRNTLGAKKHHVFMNNPLKYDDFTFYQSSYFQIDADNYGSVFSVNYDPGRPVKYAGSLLLVLGSIWHYIIRRRKKRKL